jgi:prevent-host-death family protein
MPSPESKELRIQPGKIIDQVVNRQEVIVTFRGKALARIVPMAQKGKAESKEEVSIFGMWRSQSAEGSVEETVREMRRGRQF